jgi:hypothetical protein
LPGSGHYTAIGGADSPSGAKVAIVSIVLAPDNAFEQAGLTFYLAIRRGANAFMAAQ